MWRTSRTQKKSAMTNEKEDGAVECRLPFSHILRYFEPNITGQPLLCFPYSIASSGGGKYTPYGACSDSPYRPSVFQTDVV